MVYNEKVNENKKLPLRYNRLEWGRIVSICYMDERGVV